MLRAISELLSVQAAMVVLGEEMYQVMVLVVVEGMVVEVEWAVIMTAV